ncbi:phosphoribosylanthranilate isomerase [Capnocytophaga sp. HP1101]
MNTQLKICGIRSLSEIQELKHLPIDYFGCIFAPKSPLYVSVDLASEIVAEAHSVGKQAVGVFVNAPLKEIQHIQQLTNIDIIQLHGQETAEDCQALHQAGGTLWKAFSVHDTLPDITPYLPYIQYPLFDTKGIAEGGNGTRFHWEILKNLPPYSYILAGGIEAAHIPEALLYKTAVLDVNSKVERNHRKDRGLVEEIINKLAN